MIEMVPGTDAGSTERVIEAATPSMPTVAKGLSWTAFGRIAGQGSWYLSLFVLAILVPPSAFGIVAVGAVIGSVTTLLMESGTGGTIIVTPHLSARHIRASVLRTGIAGIAFSVVAAALATPIMRLFAHSGDAMPLRIMMISVALAGFTVVPQALLKKTMNFKRQAVVMISAAVIASAASIVVGALGGGVWALVTRLVLYEAVLAVLAWIAVLDVLPRGDGAEPSRPRSRDAPWFMTIAFAAFAAQTFDNLIVGHFTNVTQLGLYAMAFSLGLAPTMQVSWQLGAVLFPAIAATRDHAQVTRRTLKSMRLMALLLLPLLPPAIVLAPTVIPSLLGNKWAGMVIPFQALMLVGVVQGIVNILAESVAAHGGARVRARIDGGWAAVTVLSLCIGASVGGIRGAAVAHVAMMVVLVGLYLRWGVRPVGLSARAVVASLSGAFVAVICQGAVTFGVLTLARDLGLGAIAAAGLAALAGVAALVIALPRNAPGLTGEARDVLAAALARVRPAPAT